MKRSRILRAAAGLTASALAASLCLIGSWLPLRLGYCLNVTSSEPVGFYRRTNARLTRGVLVLLHQPDNALAAPMLNAYIPPGFALIKRVAAVAGDMVVIDAHGVGINGSRWPSSAPLIQDQQGHLLHSYPFGIYRVPSGELWVMSNHPRGLDSRYFGPVSAASIISPLAPLVTWSSPLVAQLLAIAYAFGLAATAIIIAGILVHRLDAILIRSYPSNQEVR
jgi:conjugative transfer signal peptidase TraF